MKIGDKVKQRRKALRWTQTELAEKSEIAQAVISRLEAGEDNPKMDSLRSIAAALGCSVVDLLPDTDKKKQPLKTNTTL
jgi:XRE family transcriptional regulator, regulator of sulfur utilization